MAEHARAVAQGLRLHGFSGIRSVALLERLEAGQPHLMLAHSFGADGSVWVGDRLRKRVGLNGKSPFYPPIRLMDCLYPLEMAKLQEYSRYFIHEGGTELLHTLRLNTGTMRGEWFVTYSVAVSNEARDRLTVVTLLCPLADLVQSELRISASEAQHTLTKPLSPLSEREQQVLALIAQGMRSADMAERLNISPLTVKSHRQSLMTKLGVHNAAGLVRAFLEMNR